MWKHPSRTSPKLKVPLLSSSKLKFVPSIPAAKSSPDVSFLHICTWTESWWCVSTSRNGPRIVLRPPQWSHWAMWGECQWYQSVQDLTYTRVGQGVVSIDILIFVLGYYTRILFSVKTSTGRARQHLLFCLILELETDGLF